MNKFLIGILMLGQCLCLCGQTAPILLRVHSDQPEAHARFKLAERHATPELARRELGRLLGFLHENARLAATIDSVWRGGDTLHAQLRTGSVHRWARLSTGSVPRPLLEQAGWDPRVFSEGKPFSWRAVARLETRLQRQAQNNGYPFAAAYLDSLTLRADTLGARLALDRGPYVVFAPIALGETDKKLRLARRYLQQYLGIRPGAPYDEQRVGRLESRLRELPFVEMAQTPAVRFEGGRAAPYLWLRPRKASRFDFILGLQPAPDPTTGQIRLNLTGNANIDLHNMLGGGERLRFEWQQLRPGSQRLDLSAAWPYALGLPIGLDGRFHLFKRDTNWLDIAWDAGVQYLFGGSDFVRFFFKNTGTVLLSVDRAALLQTRALPEALDISLNSFGLETGRQRYDYRFNPRRGNGLFFRAATGFKRVRRNNLILDLEDPTDPGFRFGTLYDSLPATSVQARFEGRADVFFPFFKNSTLKVALAGGGIFPQKNLFRNELYRIGGNKLLRGFDEESLFVSAYAVGTLEYRLLTGPNSYFFVFGDFAYIERPELGNGRSSVLRDWPLGFGAGLALETKAGIFGLTYALGRQDGAPVQFGRSKIHFGYVSLF